MRILIATIVVALFVAAVSAQRPAGVPPSEANHFIETPAGWVHPKTSWGEPSLEGTWPIPAGVNLERGCPSGRGRGGPPPAIPPPPCDPTAPWLSDAEWAVRLGNAQRLAREGDPATLALAKGDLAAALRGVTDPQTALRQRSTIMDPPNGRLPELTAEGKRRSALMRSSWALSDTEVQTWDHWEDFDSWDRCITRGMPTSMMAYRYNNGIKIFQSPGAVVLSLEMIHEDRIIYTDGRPSLTRAHTQYMGEPRGRWDGNTLVVVTTNYREGPSGTNIGVYGSPSGNRWPVSDQMKTTERFTRLNDDAILYEMTVEDPVIMTRPYTVRFPLKQDPNYEWWEYACHEGNRTIRDYITSSRAERAAGQQPAAPSSGVSAAISDPVRTDAGLVSGVTLASGVRAFKGIPFAAPPVGELRWKEPQPAAKWDGVRRTDRFGNVCVQPSQPTRAPNNVSVDLPDSPKASEDCLFLNVWTSAVTANARQPVMVWIFGGAYSEGAGSSPHNDGEALSRKGAVLVTFNYRLGAFGFLSHPELTKESGRNASGNQGLMDTIATLRWVQRNIAAFGGDPNNVTIFGESAGAAMVGGLVGSPVAKGLFHRAISESGQWMGLGIGTMAPLAQAEQSAAGGGRGRGGPASSEPPAPRPLPSLAELRARSTEEVVKTLRGSGMIIDGWIVPEDLSVTFASGRQNPVDLIAGSNKDEHTSMGGNVAFRDTLAWGMRLFAERQAAIGKRAYWYVFTHEPPIEPGARDLKATHASEIVYAFNNLWAPRVYPDASSPRLAMASEKDRAMADRMSSYWVNFAKTGDPNGRGLPEWPRFKDRNLPPHILGEIKEFPSAQTLNVYDEQYAKILVSLIPDKN